MENNNGSRFSAQVVGFRKDPSGWLAAQADLGKARMSDLEIAKVLNKAGFYLKADLDTNRWTSALVRRLFDLKDDQDACAEIAALSFTEAK